MTGGEARLASMSYALFGNRLITLGSLESHVMFFERALLAMSFIFLGVE